MPLCCSYRAMHNNIYFSSTSPGRAPALVTINETLNDESVYVGGVSVGGDFMETFLMQFAGGLPVSACLMCVCVYACMNKTNKKMNAQLNPIPIFLLTHTHTHICTSSPGRT